MVSAPSPDRAFLVRALAVGINRPFARPGHMVQIKYTGEQVAQWDFHCFVSPTAQLALQYILKILYHVTGSCKGPTVSCSVGKDTLFSECLSPPRCILPTKVMLRASMQWTNILSRPRRGEGGGIKYSLSIHATKTRISSGLMAHLAHMLILLCPDWVILKQRI